MFAKRHATVFRQLGGWIIERECREEDNATLLEIRSLLIYYNQCWNKVIKLVVIVSDLLLHILTILYSKSLIRLKICDPARQ